VEKSISPLESLRSLLTLPRSTALAYDYHANLSIKDRRALTKSRLSSSCLVCNRLFSTEVTIQRNSRFSLLLISV